MIFVTWFLTLLAATSSVSASSSAVRDQTRLNGTGGGRLAQSLGMLSSDFTTLVHPAFPEYSVRIAKTEGFCDSTVGVYTGYVDVYSKHLFFYFFESRREPDSDDVLMWINGGPGGSSALGMLMELGPCNIAGPNATEFNPYGWNEHANLLFLDQPAGVGFSYADHGMVSSTEEAAIDVAAFFAILSSSFSQFQGRALHLAGESYGGRYIPAFGAAIYDQNARLVEWGIKPINLVSVIIGNGMSDELTQVSSYQEMQCTNASGLAPVMPISTCVRMKLATARCLAQMQEHCYNSLDYMNCDAVLGFCSSELYEPIEAIGGNPFDMSKSCSSQNNPTCYAEADDIMAYLNSSHTRALLHTDAKPARFEAIAFDLNGAFAASGDHHRNSAPFLAGLLERGVRALVYAGKYDLACSWLANERMTRGLEWSGNATFGTQELRPWRIDGHVAGHTRAHGGLTFATVDGAGHMVPYDKPAETLALINRWLADEPL